MDWMRVHRERRRHCSSMPNMAPTVPMRVTKKDSCFSNQVSWKALMHSIGHSVITIFLYGYLVKMTLQEAISAAIKETSEAIIAIYNLCTFRSAQDIADEERAERNETKED